MLTNSEQRSGVLAVSEQSSGMLASNEQPMGVVTNNKLASGGLVVSKQVEACSPSAELTISSLIDNDFISH